jgi:hypothetical protein
LRGHRGWSGGRDDWVVAWNAHRGHGPDGVRRPEPVPRPGRYGNPDGNCHLHAKRGRHDERTPRDNADEHVADHAAAHVDSDPHDHRHGHGHRPRHEHPDHGPTNHLWNWLLIGLLTDPGAKRGN